jgi:hypothetical protein
MPLLPLHIGLQALAEGHGNALQFGEDEQEFYKGLWRIIDEELSTQLNDLKKLLGPNATSKMADLGEEIIEDKNLKELCVLLFDYAECRKSYEDIKEWFNVHRQEACSIVKNIDTFAEMLEQAICCVEEEDADC